MIIIGEKINGAIPSVGEAIANRDAELIKNLAIRQSECHANYLDICASVGKDEEVEVLTWLINLVQEVSEVPISIDSPDPEMIAEVFPLVQRPGLINSVSDEGKKAEIIFPLVKDNDWRVLLMACDEDGIPTQVEKRVQIADKLMGIAAEYGIEQDRILIDPLVMSLSTVGDAMIGFMEVIKELKAKYPEVHFTSGLSNISYGMPYRKGINMNFLTLAISAGMDSAIMDCTNRDMYANVLAAEALMGRDRHCRKYIKAFRNGEIGPIKE